MSWRDKFRQGSFRSVPFLVESSEVTVGRRVVMHEYPLRDMPETEDLGRKGRKFSLTFFVLGANYMTERDALIEALEVQGPGLLIHPYRGALGVSVEQAQIRETTKEGGKATFTVTFLEAGEALLPLQAADTAAQVADQADQLLEVTKADFAQSYVSAGQGHLVEETESRLADMLDVGTRAIWTLLGVSLEGSPTALAAAIVSFLQSLFGTFSDDELLELYEGMSSPETDAVTGIPLTTPSRITHAVNIEALQRLVEHTALAEMCRMSATKEFATSSEALALRDTLIGQIDSQVEKVSAVSGAPIDDAVHQALIALQAAVVQDITQRGATLPRLVEFTPLTTLPAIVISYRLYGDPTRDSELVARNEVVHPGFVPGGEPLEVLAYA